MNPSEKIQALIDNGEITYEDVREFIVKDIHEIKQDALNEVSELRHICLDNICDWMSDNINCYKKSIEDYLALNIDFKDLLDITDHNDPEFIINQCALSIPIAEEIRDILNKVESSVEETEKIQEEV